MQPPARSSWRKSQRPISPLRAMEAIQVASVVSHPCVAESLNPERWPLISANGARLGKGSADGPRMGRKPESRCRVKQKEPAANRIKCMVVNGSGTKRRVEFALARRNLARQVLRSMLLTGTGEIPRCQAMKSSPSTSRSRSKSPASSTDNLPVEPKSDAFHTRWDASVGSSTD
jgi:hypothetical protein